MESKLDFDFDNNFDFEEFMNQYLADNYEDPDLSFEDMGVLEELYYRLYDVPGGKKRANKKMMMMKKMKKKKLDVELDTSDACLIEINPFRLIHQDKNHFRSYKSILEFLVACRLEPIFQMFDHEDSDDDDDYDATTKGVICGSSVVQVKPQSLSDECYYSLPIIAINEYNNHTKGAKLKLVQLEKLNHTLSFSYIGYYITFTAIEQETGHMGRYQAALARNVNAYVLGLFRDVDADKVLAITSIKGAEEEMEAKLAQEAKDAQWRKEWLAKLAQGAEDAQLRKEWLAKLAQEAQEAEDAQLSKAAETPLELQKPMMELKI